MLRMKITDERKRKGIKIDCIPLAILLRIALVQAQLKYCLFRYTKCKGNR
jgi:hypothetical protein